MVVLVGGTGILGSELGKYFEDKISLNSDWDLFEFSKLEKLLDENKPEIIINCAAIKSEKVDENPIESININIIGSCNLSKYCLKNNIRLVYISTDYVYPGTTGNYTEDSVVLPYNNYAWTKLAGEVPVKLVENHLIIRTSFGVSDFPYDKAHENLFVSKNYVDIIAPLIYKVSTSNHIGIINVGTKRKSIYDYAKARNPRVEPSNLIISKDFSLNLDKINSILKYDISD
jgi:dTDP-4-dehydrorhamnose reductase